IPFFKSLLIVLSLIAPTLYLQAFAAETTQASRTHSTTQLRPEIEQQRKHAEEQAHKLLVHDAIIAVEETEKAIAALAKNDDVKALAALETATGKINIQLARHPEEALLPVDSMVNILDLAPYEIADIKNISRLSERALNNKDYPAARALLDTLRSEIHIRTHHLPLATYPFALKEAARLIDKNMRKEASTVLLTALNTLVITDRVLPIPIINAEMIISEAEGHHEKDKDRVIKLVDKAKHELLRAKELGYAVSNEVEYASLTKTMEEIEKHIREKKNVASALFDLRESLKNLITHHSTTEKQTKFK
ncbi:MAG: YfdX family protein, partial [Burkholderiales bacterium]